MDIISRIARLITEDPDGYSDLPDEDEFAANLDPWDETFQALVDMTFHEAIARGNLAAYAEQVLYSLNEAAEANLLWTDSGFDRDRLLSDPVIVEWAEAGRGGGVIVISGNGHRDLKTTFKDTETIREWLDRAVVALGGHDYNAARDQRLARARTRARGIF